MGTPASVREFCLSILESGDLAAKLRAPRDPAGRLLSDREPGPAIFVPLPQRDASLRMAPGAAPLPRPRELEDPLMRAACLRRFAHHELMAVELFAWALLFWPDAPAGLRRGWLETLADEQRHLGLYLERLRALGTDLSAEPLSDYFWKHIEALRDHPRGPLAFLSAMGLTLEQANLDFTLTYRDAFRAVGDEESARVSQQVHDEEQLHVRLAATWLERLKHPEESDVSAYRASAPFPFDAARAKGRGFRADARRDAGLSEAMIEHVRSARSAQESRGGRARALAAPRLFPNLGAEEGDNWRRAFVHPPVRAAATLFATLFAADARFVGVDGLSMPRLPQPLADDGPAFEFLPVGDLVVPWLATREAERLARKRGVDAVGDAGIVARVHDKAFALRSAGEGPEPLRGRIHVFDADALADVEDVVREIVAKPDSGAWVLKPRFGSSGRGRLAIDASAPDVDALRAALPRLAARGGAILEPWLPRVRDLSAQCFVTADGEPRLLGVLEQLVSSSGAPLGHVLAAKGEFEREFSAAALRVVRTARDAGFVGMCGVDGFVFDNAGEACLRPVVEFNARYTLGSIALGLAQRAQRSGWLAPEQGFRFATRQESEPNADALIVRDEAGAPLACFERLDAR